MTYFQATMKLEMEGQQLCNVLWYRTAYELLDAAEFLGAAEALAAEIAQNIWVGPATPTAGNWRYQNLVSDACRLRQIVVAAWDSGFGLVSSDPYTAEYDSPGWSSADTNGPATTVILKANLEPVFGPGVGLPKTGHLRIGGVLDAAVTDGGRLETAYYDHYTDLGAAFAADITLEAPFGVLFPIRTRLTRVAGVITAIGYKDISSFVPNPVVSYTRSRLPEA